MTSNDSHNEHRLGEASNLKGNAGLGLSVANNADNAIVKELSGIRHSLERISRRLDKSPVLGEPQLTEEEQAKEESKKQQNRHASKVALALGFGFLGAKLGGLVGAKLGYVRNMIRPKPETQIIDELDPHMISDLVLFGGAGTLVGGGSGAALGWARGDRIENPGDLISKPIESFQKIIGPAPEKEEEKKEQKPLPAPAAHAPDNGWKQHIDHQRLDPQLLNSFLRK